MSLNHFARLKAMTQRSHEFTGLQFKVLLGHEIHADNETGECRPSNDLLGKYAGERNRNRVRKAVRELEAMGWLVTVSKGGGFGKAAIRRVVIPRERDSHLVALETTGTKTVPEFDAKCEFNTGIITVPPTGTVSKDMGTLFVPIEGPNLSPQLLRPPGTPHQTPQSSDEAKVPKTSEVAEAKRLRTIEIPVPLNNPEFLDAWKEWHEYRRERRLSRYSSVSERLQLAELAAWGSATAIISIQNSIRNNWQGLFEPKGNAHGRSSQRTAHRGTKENLEL